MLCGFNFDLTHEQRYYILSDESWKLFKQQMCDEPGITDDFLNNNGFPQGRESLNRTSLSDGRRLAFEWTHDKYAADKATDLIGKQQEAKKKQTQSRQKQTQKQQLQQRS